MSIYSHRLLVLHEAVERQTEVAYLLTLVSTLTTTRHHCSIRTVQLTHPHRPEWMRCDDHCVCVCTCLHAC